MSKCHTIIILPDGETWNTIDGVDIVVIDDDQFTKLCNDEISANDLRPFCEILLKDYTIND